MIKIVVADDHLIIRTRIREILSEEHDMEVFCEASSGQELLGLESMNEADVLVLDFNLPDMNAFDLLPPLKTRFPNLTVIILSALSEGMFTAKLIKLGAAGFVGKEVASTDLARTIRELIPH